MKDTIITALISCLITSFIWAKTIPEEKDCIEVVRIEKQTVDWNKLIEAIIWRESRGNDNSVNHKSNAVGCLQITPIYLKQCNKIAGHEKYKLSDRYSRSKSIEMFNLYQSYFNPEKDLHLAIKLHNPRANYSYHRDIEKKYKELINK
jgi:hypothetical protein|nr:MAG TPA: hypothetical protein [Caudoviricetes sp.]